MDRLEPRQLLSTINGTVYVDADGAGTAGQPISGAIVYSDTNFNGILDAGEPSATSDIGGSYALTVPGGTTYMLRCQTSGSYFISQPTEQVQYVTIQPGFAVFNINFRALAAGSYGVNFFRDVNGNGTKDSGDPAVTGRTVWADLDNDGVLDPTEPAAAAGNTGFAKLSLRPGAYTLRFSKPAGWSYTTADGGAVSYSVTAQQTNLAANAGSNGPPLVDGFVFTDVNGNTRYDDVDTPLAGSTVFYDVDGNNAVSAPDVVQQTAADGTFHFTGPFLDGKLIYAGGAGYSVSSFTTGDNNLFLAATNAHGAISGFIYADLDSSGTQNGTEPFLPGRPVYLDLNDNGTPDPGEPMSVTANNGYFRLDAPVGMRRVRTLASDDYAFGANGGAFPLVNVVANGNLYGAGQLGMIDNRPTRNRCGIQGYSFEDTNRNGRMDPGERGLPGRTVYADADFDGIFDVGERSAVSDSSGLFVITELQTSHSYDLRQLAAAGSEPIWVGSTGVNRVTFGSTAALAFMDFASRTIPPLGLTAAFTGDNGTYPQNIRLQFNRDVSKSLGHADVILYSISDNVYATSVISDFDQSIVDGVTVANLHFPGLVSGYYRLTIRANAVCDAGLKGLATDYNYEFLTYRPGVFSSADTIRIQPNAGATAAEVYLGANPTPFYTVPFSANLGGLFIDARGGDDTLICDASLPTTVSLTGNDGTDTLIVTGSPAAAENVTFDTAGASAAGGTSIIAGADVERRRFDGNGGLDSLNVASGPAVTFPDSQDLQSLTVAAGASAGLTAGTASTILTRNLSIAGRLDLTDGALTFDYSGASPLGSWNGSAYTGVSGLVASGRNGGAWNGNGIVTSSASGNLTTLGVAEIAGDVRVKYTYAGDANLDGKINVDDYGHIDSNVVLPGITGWINGDFNYDGKINVDDYGIIDSNVPIQGPPLGAAQDAQTASPPLAPSRTQPLSAVNSGQPSDAYGLARLNFLAPPAAGHRAIDLLNL
jgi:SdrD B-like domain